MNTGNSDSKSNGNGQAHFDIGGTLGGQGVNQLLERAGNYCSCERQRKEAENAPKIARAREELASVDQRRDLLRREVAQLPPDTDVRSRRRHAVFECAFAVVLIIAGFGFSFAALEPFQLGWKTILYSIGLALIVPYSVDMVLQHWAQHQRFLRGLALSGALVAILAMVSLSFVRAHLFAAQLQQMNPAVIFDGEKEPRESQRPNTFYQETQLLLTVFMVFASLAMEVNAGCALYNAGRFWAETRPDAGRLREELGELERRRVMLIHDLAALEREPQEFVNRFWRDFHESMIKAAQPASSIVKMWAFLLIAVLVFSTRVALARDRVNIVVAVDLSGSVAAAGPDQKTEFDKNLTAVSRLLASLPAGSRVTVIGITGQSFSRPYVLLSAELDANEGYFKERIASGRRELVQAWQKRRKTLVSQAQQTDVLGALVLSSQLLRSKPGERSVLLLFSDMRNETGSINFARSRIVPSAAMFKKAQADHLIADLKGVEVYALGVDGAGRSVAYWDSLRDFWTTYFRETGAVLRSYSTLREIPEIAP